MTASRTRFDQRLAALGPDVLAAGVRRRRASCAACARTTRRARSATRCSTSAPSPGIGNDLEDRGLLRRGASIPWRPTRPRSATTEALADRRRGPAADGASARADGIRPRRHRDLRQRRAALPALRHARSGRAGRATTTVRHTGARDARRDPPHALRRVGHKGADLIAPGNTLASFDAALAAGVDMIEFDVLPETATARAGSCSPTTTTPSSAAPRSRSRRASPTSARTRAPASSSTSTSSCAGYERRVVDALREHGLADRALISTMEERQPRASSALASPRSGSAGRCRRSAATRWTGG